MLDIEQVFYGLAVDDNARRAHTQVINHLKRHGWRCQREYPAPEWGDGHTRWIDIMATKESVRLAIEVDRLSPKLKSIRKLNDIDADYKWVLLRGGGKRYREGVIEVLSLEVDHAT